MRHDFAYRNYGQLGLGATDEVRRRVEETASLLGLAGLLDRQAGALDAVHLAGPDAHDGAIYGLGFAPVEHVLPKTTLGRDHDGQINISLFGVGIEPFYRVFGGSNWAVMSISAVPPSSPIGRRGGDTLA